jgi:ABC-type branched-subunit amino acid transport system substrate-binding protein
MPSRRTLLQWSLAAAPSMALGPLAWADVDAREPIRLGQSAPLSGSQAKLGLAVRDAAAAAFAEVNARGGIGGRNIELITLDDEDRPERTAVNVKLLASEHKVMALFGFVGAGAHRAGPRGAQAEGLPYVAPVSGAAELRNGTTPWVYMLRASHLDEIHYIARHTELVGIERIGLVFEYNSQGWELRDALVDVLQARGREVASISSIDHEGTAYSLPGAVSAILRGNPQAVILGADYVASARFVQAMREAGYTGLFYTLSTVGGSALMGQLGPLSAGMSVTQVVPFPWTHTLQVSRDYQLFCQRRGLGTSFEGMEAYLGAGLLVDALRRARVLTPAKLAESLDALPPHDFGGYVGSLRRGQDEARTTYVDLTVYTRDGKFIR